MYEQISANKRKTVLLIFLFVLLLSAVGLAVDYFLRGGVVGIVIVAIIVTVSSFVVRGSLIGSSDGFPAVLMGKLAGTSERRRTRRSSSS